MKSECNLHTTTEQKIEEIHRVLIGDPLKGIPGVITLHYRIVEDLYGINAHGEPIDSKKNTLLIRMSELEDKQRKVFWTFTGVVAAFTSIKFGLTAIIDKVFTK